MQQKTKQVILIGIGKLTDKLLQLFFSWPVISSDFRKKFFQNILERVTQQTGQ